MTPNMEDATPRENAVFADHAGPSGIGASRKGAVLD